MNANYMLSFFIVLALCMLSYLGGETPGLRYLFGIVMPYFAIVIFIFAFISRVMGWARSTVPFRIPTTCGQQKSFSWIKPNRIDNPFSKGAVVLRMILEIVCFRSLFRNTRMAFKNTKTGIRIAYDWEIFLWIAALAFHYTFLVVLLRHLRFFFDPVPLCIQVLEFFDGFIKIEFLSDVIQVGLPGIYISGIILLAAVTFLFLRRIFSPNIRYISLPADFFPLFLIMGIAITGIMMRYFTKVDIVGIKEFTMGLVNLSPTLPQNVGGLFYIHIFLVSVLLAYFPFSKLMHMGGIFLSPTRNTTADTRATRHVNPWNYPVKVHTYEQYEDEFREKMIEAGLPVEKKE